VTKMSRCGLLLVLALTGLMLLIAACVTVPAPTQPAQAEPTEAVAPVSESGRTKMANWRDREDPDQRALADYAAGIRVCRPPV
jgi:hypothetical protein